MVHKWHLDLSSGLCTQHTELEYLSCCADLRNALRSFNIKLSDKSPILGLQSETNFAIYQPQNDTLVGIPISWHGLTSQPDTIVAGMLSGACHRAV